jgi:hypothetical protein
MDAQGPPDNGDAPVVTAPPPNESVEDRHARELSQSLDALEDTVETGVEHLLERALPFVLGVAGACLAGYAVFRRVRNRAHRRHLAEAS